MAAADTGGMPVGVFDFIKDKGSRILKSSDEKIGAVRSKAREQGDGGLAARAKEAAERAREAALEARERATEQAEEAREKAAEFKEVANDKRTAAREAFVERRAEARKADELEDYLETLAIGGDVDVRFDDGVVYLEGSVPDQSTLERVVLAMGNVEGVERVDEDLDVMTPANAATMYTVEPGDTLTDIAQAIYGDGDRYYEIFEANRPMLSDPNMIYPGQVLRIP